jgi:hypothetical protein
VNRLYDWYADSIRPALEELRASVTIWALAGALGFAALLVSGTLLILFLSRGQPISKGVPTAVLNVIPAPTATPILPTPAPQASPTPTAAVPPAPLPGVIAIGTYVQISSTGNTGLRFRSEPGLKGDVLFVGMEAEVFQVNDGPRDVDGYTWWYLIAPYDAQRTGWAVSNYLTVVQNP